MTYSFRFRCALNDHVRLSVDSPRLYLHGVEGDTRVVYIANEGDGPGLLRDAESLTVRGIGFLSAEEAQLSCAQWVAYVKAGFAGATIGAKFDVREPFDGGPIGPAEPGHRLDIITYSDDGRPIVFRSNVKTSFARAMPGKSQRGIVESRVRDEIAHVSSRCDSLTPEVRLAYDLYSAAQAIEWWDAQLVTYVSAVEALIKRPPRSQETLDLVAELKQKVKDSSVGRSIRDSLLGQLREMEKESIKATGRALVRSLTLSLGDRSAEELFARSYDVRSAIVHGSGKRPTESEVASLAVELNFMVGRLISTVAAGEERTY